MTKPTDEEIEINFLKAAEDIKKSNKKCEDNILLELYGYYKQGTIGDCNTACPSLWQIVEKAKWDSWNNHKGLKKKHAQKKYIKLVEKIMKE